MGSAHFFGVIRANVCNELAGLLGMIGWFIMHLCLRHGIRVGGMSWRHDGLVAEVTFCWNI